MASKLVVRWMYFTVKISELYFMRFMLQNIKNSKYSLLHSALWRDFFSKDVKFILVHAVYCKCDKIFTSLGNFPATFLLSCKMNSHKIQLIVNLHLTLIWNLNLNWKVCNLCKPKTKIISANTKTRFNLKRHLSALHSQKDVDDYEKKNQEKKNYILKFLQAVLVLFRYM